jgi:hypothetical protein
MIESGPIDGVVPVKDARHHCGRFLGGRHP